MNGRRLVAAVLAFSLSGCGSGAPAPARSAADGSSTLGVPSEPSGGSTARAAGSAVTVDVGGLSVPVQIFRPAGPGPFSAVVWMHSCSGLTRGARHMRDWTRRLVDMGYLVAVPDSFTPRGHPNGVCGYGLRVPPLERADDAYAALALLEHVPEVRADRIGLIGHSHGGWTVLATMSQSVAPRAKAKAHAVHDFAGAVAFYPDCSTGAWLASYRTIGPLLILTGEWDDWTPAAPCERLAEHTRAQGQPVAIKVYPSAYHSFDGYAPVTRVPEARQGRGATVGGNASAREDSVRQVQAFFAAQLETGAVGSPAVTVQR